jgi:hypothetical protein
MPITAEFSNGHTDTYKGSRPVKAAWMITDRESGKVLASGHSLDLAKARKTAEGNVAENHAAGAGNLPIWNPRGHTIAHLKLRRDAARANGWDGKGKPDAFIKRINAERKAARDASVIIEIIEL